jgi:hypothetical protein
MNDTPNNLPTVKPALAAGGRVQAIVPQDIEQAHRLAIAITQADMAPKSYNKDANKVMLGIMQGMEVGMTPMVALQSIAIIHNMPSIYGDGAMALVQGSGQLEDMVEEPMVNDQGEVFGFTCTIKRAGRTSAVVRTFTLDDAQQAGLTKKQGPWKDYPQRMLQMRARSWAMRDGFADVLKGLHIREEIEDMGPLEQSDDGAYAPPPPKREDFNKDDPAMERAVEIADAEGVSPEEALGRAREEAESEETVPEEPLATDLHVTVYPPEGDKGGWPQWRTELEALLDACTSHGNIEALKEANGPALATYAGEQPKSAKLLSDLFAAKRGTFANAPL